MRRVLAVLLLSTCLAGAFMAPALAATATTAAGSSQTTAANTPAVAPVTATTVVDASPGKKSARTTVNVLIGILLGLAAIVIALSVWYWRVTKPLPAQLEPLATMSTRAWRKAPPARREVALERVRPRRALDPMLSPAGGRTRVDTPPFDADDDRSDVGRS